MKKLSAAQKSRGARLQKKRALHNQARKAKSYKGPKFGWVRVKEPTPEVLAL